MPPLSPGAELGLFQRSAYKIVHIPDARVDESGGSDALRRNQFGQMDLL